MRTLLEYLTMICLSLWFGGMSIFTFLVTPTIFRAYTRDLAGEIVGHLFATYFPFALAISAAVLVLLLVTSGGRASVVLASLAVVIALYVNFGLYPELKRVKQEVASFQSEPESPARLEFRRLHVQSAVLNLALIADGLALLVMQMRNKG